MEKLSPKQQAILDFVLEFRADRGYPPSVREIQRACRISSTSVVDYNLRILEKKGHLKRDREVSRGITVPQDRAKAGAVVKVPVLGAIAAGEPIPVPQPDTWRTTPEASVAVPESMIKGKRQVYALRVKGTSMIEDLINDGDVVVIEHRQSADNGDTVVAWLKGQQETTLKRFYRDGRRVRLQPANSALKPRYVQPEDLEVQGRVVAVLRGLT